MPSETEWSTRTSAATSMSSTTTSTTARYVENVVFHETKQRSSQTQTLVM